MQIRCHYGASGEGGSTRTDATDGAEAAVNQQPVGTFFPGVDAWFERPIPMGLHRWLALAGAIVFAALAGAHAQETGFAGAGLWSAIALGVFFGRILVPLFNITVKLLLLCLCLAVLGAIGWVSYGLITGAL